MQITLFLTDECCRLFRGLIFISTSVVLKPGFLTGPADLADNETPINAPRVFVGPDNAEHFLIIYQV